MANLYIVSTPIGNLEDITLRAIKTFFKVDIIACEDTRRTGVLLNHLLSLAKLLKLKPTKPKLISYYEENELQRVPEIINFLKKGKNVALVSNAGTPTLADPGFKLVKECLQRGIKVIPIPGASGVLAALVVSGLATDRFIFLGYLPKKREKKRKALSELFLSLKRFKKGWTVIFYESPHRLKETLENLRSIFGDIKISIARELTKVHEEVWQGKISQALLQFSKPKGEFTLLFRTPPK